MFSWIHTVIYLLVYDLLLLLFFFFFSSRRRHTRLQGDWSSDVCSSDLLIDVPDLVDPEPRREPRAVQAQVEVERAAERRLGEGAGAGAVTQDRRAGLEPEDGGRGPLVRRGGDRVAGGTALRLHRPQGR